MKNLYYIACFLRGSPKLAKFRAEKETPYRYYVEVDSIEFILSRFYFSRILDKADFNYFVSGSKDKALAWLKQRLKEKEEELEAGLSEIKVYLKTIDEMGESNE